jgi:hypothetical protein
MMILLFKRDFSVVMYSSIILPEGSGKLLRLLQGDFPSKSPDSSQQAFLGSDARASKPHVAWRQ